MSGMRKILGALTLLLCLAATAAHAQLPTTLPAGTVVGRTIGAGPGDPEAIPLSTIEAQVLALPNAVANSALAQVPALTLKGNNSVGTANVADLTVADVLTLLSPQRVLSAQNSGDTNDSASGSGSYRAYNLTYTVPAGFMTANRVLRVTAHFRLTTGSAVPVLDLQLKVGGTVVAHFQPNAVVTSGTNRQYGLVWMLQAVAAPSASSNVETVMFGNSNAPGSVTTASDTAQPVALATNGTLAITIESQWATAGTGTNQIKLSQLIVEALN